MALIATSILSPTTGAVPSFSAASASDTFATPGDDGRNFIVYRNTNAATRTVTILVTGNTQYGQPNPDPVYTLGATTGELWIPVFRSQGDTTGVITVTLSATTNVTVAYVRIT